MDQNCFTDPEIEALKDSLMKKADFNGYIARDDLVAVIKDSTQGFLSPAMSSLLASEDLLADSSAMGNRVSVNKFIAAVKRSKYGEEILETFRAFDTDGDGHITHNELRDVLKKLGEDFSEKEVKSLIQEADRDGDGRVDFQEFEKMIIERD